MKELLPYTGPRRKREKRPEKLFEEIMVENFLNMGNKTDIQIQEGHRTPNKTNPMRTRSKLKTLKIKCQKLRRQNIFLNSTSVLFIFITVSL